MLQEYLNEQFILTTEDANFDKLRKASAEVAKKISKDKVKIISFTLVATDPNISVSEKEVQEVKQIITDSWSTFMANSKDTALTIIRAVMLDALTVVSKDLKVAALIWQTGRNVVKYYKLGRERDIISKFLIDLGNRLEKDSADAWSFSPEEEIVIPEISVTSVEKGEIEAVLKAAAIHSGWGEGGENPQPQTTGNAEWGKFFSTRAAKGLTDVINKVLKKHASEISQNQKQFFYRNSIMQMRTHLLWWKEACYSTSYKGSYKDLKDGELQIILATDYASFVPPMYPTSVDYFLREVHNNFSGLKGKKMKLLDILKLIEQSPPLKEIVTNEKVTEGRLQLAVFLDGLVHGNFSNKDVLTRLGIEDSIELSLADFTSWIFHDLQSLKLAQAS